MAKTERGWTRFAWLAPVLIGGALRLRHALGAAGEWLPHLGHGEGYYEGAVNFLGYGVLADRTPCFFPNGSRGPLYQAFIVLVELFRSVPHPGHVVFAQAALSTLAVAAAYDLGASLISPWAGLLGALWMALDARQIEAIGRVDLSGFYPAAILALAAMLVRWTKEPSRRTSALLGLTFASTMMCRSSHYAFAPLLLAACAVLPAFKRHRKELPALGAVVAVLLLTPALANHVRFGRFHPMDAEAGALRLYAASVGEPCCAPGQFERYVAETVAGTGNGALPSYRFEGLVIRKALSNIAGRPGRYALTILRNMRDFWAPYWPALVLGLAAAWLHVKNPGFIALLLALASFLGYHVMVVDLWHSEVVLPLLSVLAGAGLAAYAPKGDFFRKPAAPGRASAVLIGLFCVLYPVVLLIFAAERISLATGRIANALGEPSAAAHKAPLALLDLSVANSQGRYGLESRAFVYSAMGLYDKACADLTRAGKPGNCAAQAKLGAEGLSVLKGEPLRSDVPILSPCDWYGWQSRGAQGADYLSRCAAASPRDARVRLNLGMARFLAGDKNAAAKEFRAAVSIEPTFVEAWLSLSTALAETGRGTQAVEAADRAAALASTPELLEAARSTRASALGPRGPRTR